MWVFAQPLGYVVNHIKMKRMQRQREQENAMCYNNRDDLLQLGFTLKISVFLEVYI